MKIAFIVNEFPALSETFVLNQITGLIDRGHDVDIIAHRPRDESLRHPDIDTYQLEKRVRYERPPNSYYKRLCGAIGLLLSTRLTDLPRAMSLLNVFRYGKEAASLRLLYLAAACRGTPYDILLCHSGMNGLKALRMRELGLVEGKITTFFHGYDLSGYLHTKGRHVYRELFKQGDMFLPISKFWLCKLNELGCLQDEIRVHRMGVDLSRFIFRQRDWDGKTPLRIVTVARLVEKKGIRFGIQAVSDLVKKNLPLTYTIIGDGPLRAELEQCIDSLGVGDHVQMLGAKNQSDVRDALAGAHVLLAPSVTAVTGDQEGIPVAIMEAMATGLLVVSTEHSGIPELIEDGVTGFLAPEADSTLLSKKISLLYARPELLGTLSRAGYEKVVNQHDIHQLNDELVQLLKSLRGDW